MRRFIAVTIVASACSTESTPASPSRLQASCSQYAATSCDRRKECAPAAFDSMFVDLATCTSATTADCIRRYDAPGSRASVDAIEGCTAGIEAAACEDLYGGRASFECEVSAGERPVGAPCGVSSQCATRACGGTDATCGRCVANGEPRCPDTPCDRSSVCLGGRCVGGGIGDACGATGLYCEATLACVSGSCRTLADQPGDSCVGYGACAISSGLVCNWNGMTYVCVAPRAAGAGESCGDPTSVRCIGGTFCDPTRLVCAPRAALGAPCTAQDGCIFPAGCVRGTCASLDPASCR